MLDPSNGRDEGGGLNRESHRRRNAANSDDSYSCKLITLKRAARRARSAWNRLMLEVIDMTELVEHVVRCYCAATEASAVGGVTTRNDRSRGSTEPIRMWQPVSRTGTPITDRARPC